MNKPFSKQARPDRPQRSAFEMVRLIQKRIFFGVFLPAITAALVTGFIGLEAPAVILVMAAFFSLIVCFIVDLHYESPGW